MAKLVISVRRTILVIAVLFLLYRLLIDPTPFDYKNDDNAIKNIVENYMDEDDTQGVVQVSAQKGSVAQIPEISDQEPQESEGCGGFVSSELLPNEDDTDDFAEFSPVNVDSNFLDASRFLSMQTSLLRNTNLQIRPEPEVPREKVCPWNQSTIYRENTEPRNKGFHDVDSENF